LASYPLTTTQAVQRATLANQGKGQLTHCCTLKLPYYPIQQ
jgi:hypothetical protein